MNQIDTMKLALEALEAGEYYLDDLEAIVYGADDLGTHEDRAKMQEAITALREALAEQPAQQCRTDGRCQYAIDSGAEGLGHCPKGKCVMPAQQEPVALGYMNAGHVHEMQQGRLPYGYVYPKEGVGAHVALYTSPSAQRTWVGLTDEELEEIVKRGAENKPFHHWFARAIEAKLKEKNT